MKAKQQYRVIAGAVTLETMVGKGRAAVDFYRGAILPADVPQAQLDTELARGTIEPVQAQPAPSDEDAVSAPEPAPPGEDEVPPPPPEPLVPEGMSVTATLDWVGKDVERAQLALAAETGDGGQNRATLVDRLEKLLAAAEADSPPAA